MTFSKFHTDDLQTSVATVQNAVSLTIRMCDCFKYMSTFFWVYGRCSVLSIATSYEVDSPRSEPWCGQVIFSSPYSSRATLDPTEPLLHRVPGVTRPWSGVDQPPPFSLSVPSWSLEATFTFRISALRCVGRCVEVGRLSVQKVPLMFKHKIQKC